ncbi:bidirectional [NiFe] hydrogenase diaphorase subunit [Phycisphaerales bacterium]|nr:bidirectional [NiFe] hydrogenase diaphorase subunit [Phycisphaerales bacterium]
MSAASGAFRKTHAPDQAVEAVLPVLHEAAADGPLRTPADASALARCVSLPVATVRGAMSSFSEVGRDPASVRVCAGTSCMLAGGGPLARELSARRPCHPVYCLGYCDRSPAALTPSGCVVLGADAAAIDAVAEDSALPHPPPPSVRCVARHAIVTARLLRPDAGATRIPRYDGLAAALRLAPDQVVAAVMASGLRGRGGAAFPTGRKWQLAAAAPGEPKFIVANGDEGDPGSFIDRELMERDPHAILEGMAIAAHAIGATRGYVFIRSEYPVSVWRMKRAVADATMAGVLGEGAPGREKGLRIEVVQGLGSYVCGEETALLSAIEGQRGEVRPRPPYPVEAGLFGLPTVVDNVETLADIPWILEHGAEAYSQLGTPDSRGTKAICLNHGFARPGIVEVEFGVTLREVIENLAGGGAGGAEIEAVLLGGPMGSIVTPDQWDAPICFTGMSRRDITLGHGGLVAIPKGSDWRAILRHLLVFMRDESCGKCVPCRLGSARAYELAREGLSGESLAILRRILGTMTDASLCAFGRETPGPVRTILEKFGGRVMAEERA